MDPEAHAATTHRLARLHARHYPLLLPPEATSGWDTRLPMDTRTISPALFAQAFPAGVDIIMTSPPMLAKHLPKTIRGSGQPPHATVLQIHDLIHHLATTQEGGLGFVWDTPSGPPLPAQIKDIMGPSTVLDTPKLGSGAHRPTRIWQNLLPTAEIETAYAQLPENPHTINEILELAGIAAWRMPAEITSTNPAHPPKALPRFNPRQPPTLRMDTRHTSIGGLSLLEGPFPPPSYPEVTEVLMGFTRGMQIQETSP